MSFVRSYRHFVDIASINRAAKERPPALQSILEDLFSKDWRRGNGERTVDKAEVEALAQMLEMWAALDRCEPQAPTRGSAMFQAAAVIRRQAAEIEALHRARIGTGTARQLT